MKRSFIFLFIAMSITAVLGSGCSMTTNFKVKPSLEPLPSVTKVPIAVGVYYSPDFRIYEHRRSISGGWFVVPMGKASVEMFDGIFPVVFNNVVPVADLPPFTEARTDIVAVIEPRIEAFHFRTTLEKDTERNSVTYRFTVYTLEGVPLSSWTVRGKGALKSRVITKSINDNMRNASIKFIESFRESFGTENLALLSKNRLQEVRASSPSLDKSTVFANAEALVDPEKLKVEFGAPLNDAGIIAVKVSVRNDGNQKLLVRGSDIHLVLPDENRIAPASSSVLTSKLEEVSHAGLWAGILFGGLVQVGTTLAVDAEKGKKAITAQDNFQAKQIGERVHDKNDVSEGFVYFIPPEGTPAFDKASLAVWFVDTGTARGVRVDLPLENLSFKGAPARK